jgi:phosphoketolase
MGQGHTVSAIDSLNVLVGNTTPAHAERYDVTDAGLTRFVRDFYSYRLTDAGRQDSPLGSHVNVHTAGGLIEGGYLGFAELQYVHLPLPGERLVAFLSDGAFEEQRGSDWAPLWWRAEDSGLVVPIMIANGRRIDQRTTMYQQGGVPWLVQHLTLNGFDPIVFDGRDPAAFAWMILEGERRLEERAHAVRAGAERYPVRLPYGIAVTTKGYGFPGAATNAAHNLPLGTNPRTDADAARRFADGARDLWVPPEELREARECLERHARSGRPRERDHVLVRRGIEYADPPAPAWIDVTARTDAPERWSASAPMRALDAAFVAAVDANPALRPRVGNPDEMRSNRMDRTLERLKHRVVEPEAGAPEDLGGAIVTALNEEAVASAALGNTGGIGLVVSYEAFAAKMHGVLRQRILFAHHELAAGRPPGWLSVPIVLTSHLWENGKNEQSHQDPSLCEALLAENAPASRVLFPPDANATTACLRGVYRTRGQVWTLVAAKGAVPDLLTGAEAERLLHEGGLALDWLGHETASARLLLCAVGAYQLAEVARASLRLAERGVPHAVHVLLEPGRFRTPRDAGERAHAVPDAVRERILPARLDRRVLAFHGHPEALLGTLGPLRPLRIGPGDTRTLCLGFTNHGGTLDVGGMLFVNESTWAHVVLASARVLELAPERVLDEDERAALAGKRSPQGVIVPVPVD